MGPKMSLFFVRYIREFVITVIVITEFDCTYFLKLAVDKKELKTNNLCQESKSCIE